MTLDPVVLSRIQFAVTICVHFVFPAITIGLAWLLVVSEWCAWRKKDDHWKKVSTLFSKLFAITFGFGVATGIVMEFQFGMNWAGYSKYVGDIFGAPLAAEGVFAFFLESSFLGLYLFGKDKIPAGWRWFAILMVATGATISAFWIVAANAWQQTPAGYVIHNGRAELTDFWAAVIGPSFLVRYGHTMFATLAGGSFFVSGFAAYWLLKKPMDQVARNAMALALISGLIFSVLVAFPFGDLHAANTAKLQPEKFSAMEGVMETQSGAPLLLFAMPKDDDRNTPEDEAKMEMAIDAPIPGLLSLMAFHDAKAEIKGYRSFPADARPPLTMTFVSFHTMVGIGTAMIFLMGWGCWLLKRGRLWESRWTLRALVLASPLPILGCQLGWIVAEVGRQPWVVYFPEVEKRIRTADMVSKNLSGGEVFFSLLLFSVLGVFLLGLYGWLLRRQARQYLSEISQ